MVVSHDAMKDDSMLLGLALTKGFRPWSWNEMVLPKTSAAGIV